MVPRHKEDTVFRFLDPKEMHSLARFEVAPILYLIARKGTESERSIRTQASRAA